MSYYCFNRHELLQNAKDKYHNCGKEKGCRIYLANKDVIKARNRYRNLSEKEKEAKRKYQADRYKKMKEKSS